MNDLKTPKQSTSDQMYGSLEVIAWMWSAEGYIQSALFHPTTVHRAVTRWFLNCSRILITFLQCGSLPSRFGQSQNFCFTESV